MAPVTRSSLNHHRRPEFVSKKSSEALFTTEPSLDQSWELTIPETGLNGRATSESRSFDGSYQEDEMMTSYEDDGSQSLLCQQSMRQSQELISTDDENMPPKTLTPDDAEHILHPLRETANRVGREVEEFAAVLDRFNPMKAINKAENEAMAFELLNQYQSISTKTVQRLRDRHSSGKKSRSKYRGFEFDGQIEEMDVDRDEPSHGETTPNDLERWEQEANTWDLLRRLMNLKHGDHKKETRPLTRFSSERDYWDAFLNSNDLAAERATVLDWLKNIAEEDREDINVMVHDLQHQAERGDIINNGWLYTKLAVKKTKRNIDLNGVLNPKDPNIRKLHLNNKKAEVLITQLDPDAPCRQKLNLEPEDIYFERAIWLGCYEMLRRGTEREKIKEWCEERSEIWRAVSMSGLPDPNNEARDESSNQTSISLWRRMCYANAKRQGTEKYEQAVYGVLSGDLDSVLAVSDRWDDFVFAHYNSLLTSQFEYYLRDVNPDQANLDALQSFPFYDAVQYHGSSDGVALRLIESLKEKDKAKVEAKKPMKLIQGVLIADEIEVFVEEQGLMISHMANKKDESNIFPKQALPEWVDAQSWNFIFQNDEETYDHDSLRVLTHVLLAFKSFGFNFGGEARETAVENVIVAYIQFLKLAGMEELIPTYAVQLSEERMYAILGRILIDVLQPEQRETLIHLMEDLAIDVQRFVQMQTDSLMVDYFVATDGYPAIEKVKIVGLHRKQKRVIPNFTESEIPRIYLLLIRSLEWYLLVDGLWVETFVAGANLYNLFYRNGNLSAAELLSSSMPSNLISLSKSSLLCGATMDLETIEAVLQDFQIPEGLEDGEALEEAQSRRRIMKYMLDSSKCFRELEMLERALYAMDEFTVTVDDFQSNSDNMTKDNANKWRKVISPLLQKVRASIDPLLHGWLLETETTDAQLQTLRLVYLPNMILGFIWILEFSANFLSRGALLESMDLAATIANDENKLIELFIQSEKMGELVEAFAGNALMVVKAGEGEKREAKRSDRHKGWGLGIWGVELLRSESAAEE